MEEARVNVFGSFNAITPSGMPAAFRTNRAAEVVARLLVQNSKQMSRQSLAAEIWPDADESDQLRNLRPALTYAKSALQVEDAIVQDGSLLKLSSNVQSDWDEALRAERKARVAQNSEERTGMLLTLESLLQSGLLTGWKVEWAQPHIEFHRDRRARVLLQLAEEFATRGQMEPAAEYSRKLMRLNSFSEKAMRLRLRILGELDRLTEARAEFGLFSQSFKRELGVSVSPELREYAAYVCKGRLANRGIKPITTQQQEFFAHLVSMLVEKEPECLLGVFASRDLNWSTVIHDSEMRPYLEEILDRTSGWSTDRRSVAKRLLQIYFQAFEFDSLVKLADSLGAGLAEDDIDQIAVHNYRGFANQHAGRLDQAVANFASAAEIATAQGNDYLLAVSQVNQALTLDAAGKFERSHALYLSAIHKLEADETPNGLFSLSIARSSLMAHQLLLEDIGAALKTGNLWWRSIEQSEIAQVEHGGRCIYGLALILGGEPRGREFVLAGIEASLSRPNTGFMLRGALYSCWALAALGSAEAGDAASALTDIMTRSGIAGSKPLDIIRSKVGPPLELSMPTDLPELLSWLYDRIAQTKGAS